MLCNNEQARRQKLCQPSFFFCHSVPVAMSCAPSSVDVSYHTLPYIQQFSPLPFCVKYSHLIVVRPSKITFSFLLFFLYKTDSVTASATASQERDEEFGRRVQCTLSECEFRSGFRLLSIQNSYQYSRSLHVSTYKITNLNFNDGTSHSKKYKNCSDNERLCFVENRVFVFTAESRLTQMRMRA